MEVHLFCLTNDLRICTQYDGCNAGDQRIKKHGLRKFVIRH